jgi:putative oxidoreductase
MSTLSPTTAGNPTAPVFTDQPGESTANAVQKLSELGGRILLSVLFLLSGLGKVGAYAGTSAYMSSFGVPGELLPLVIATEVLGALAIIVGWKTRVTAFLLAGYSLLTAVIFHSNFGDQIQMIMFFKNVSIAGGFLLLVANGAGPLSIDRRIAK